MKRWHAGPGEPGSVLMLVADIVMEHQEGVGVMGDQQGGGDASREALADDNSFLMLNSCETCFERLDYEYREYMFNTLTCELRSCHEDL